MKAIAVCAAAVLSFGVASSAYALQLQVINKSKTSIHHLYVSAENQKEWGPDQLGDAQVDPGNQFNLHGIQAGTWDVKLVAEDGTECEVDGAEFDGSKQWVITEKMLDNCGG